MLTHEEIDQLARFDGEGARVLSTYLDLDPTRQVKRTYRIAFEDLVHDLRDRLDEPSRAELSREVAENEAWLQSHAPRGKGFALFSCAPRRFWQAYFLPVTVKDHLAFEAKPDVAPLLALLDEHERYVVALVDKQNARLFTVFMGAIEESEAFKDFVPGKHDLGGLSQANYQRHHEAHVHWHLKRVANHLADMRRRQLFDHLVIAGPEEATNELRRILPRALAQRVVGVIPAETSAGAAEILTKTLDIERQAAHEFESRLLDELLETAGARGRATCGVGPSLDALGQGAVRTLVLSEGVHEGGSECPRCGRIEPGRLANCPACGAPTRPVHDLFHAAARRALLQAGSVETLHGDAARRLQERCGGLAAFLRHR
jgi:peptide subunit release factor 1 (eRF1)